MFQASSPPPSGAKTTAVAASGLLSELGDSSAVGRGRAGRLKKTLRSFQTLEPIYPSIQRNVP